MKNDGISILLGRGPSPVSIGSLRQLEPVEEPEKIRKWREEQKKRLEEKGSYYAYLEIIITPSSVHLFYCDNILSKHCSIFFWKAYRSTVFLLEV